MFQFISKYFAKMRTATWTFQRTYWCSLKLYRNQTLLDDKRVAELYNIPGWFNTVAIVVPSIEEFPRPDTSLAVIRAIKICKDRGFRIIWGRQLWPAWLSDWKEMKGAELRGTFYQNALATIKKEAEQIGATQTLLDVEPYGTQSPQIEDVRRGMFAVKSELDDLFKLTPTALQIIAIIRHSICKVSQVDFVTPCSSSDSPWHYAWIFNELGVRGFDQKTYFEVSTKNELNIQPPEGRIYRTDVWGTAVGLSQNRGNNVIKPTFDDVQRLEKEDPRDRLVFTQGFDTNWD